LLPSWGLALPASNFSFHPSVGFKAFVSFAYFAVKKRHSCWLSSQVKVSYCKRISTALVVCVMKLFKRATDIQTDSAMTLAQASVGCSVRINSIKGAACDRLRSMGFCESMEVKKLSNGHNMLCTVCGTKLALNKKLAAQILVCPV
jgi:Fe2+ transport system protein FeoA